MSVIGPERLKITTCSDCSALGDTGPRPTGCSHQYGERGETEYVRADLHRGAVDALREIRERTDKEPDDEMIEDVVAIADRVLYPSRPSTNRGQ